jgi:hypothetical protein
MERAVTSNVYFDLTETFNAAGPIAILGSGQAVVFHRVAIMSKDGDWVLREKPEACHRVRAILAEREARYRPGAPLDPRWLAGGWSSHFEFFDDRGRRIRCDFFSRPPRIDPAEIDRWFAQAPPDRLLLVVDIGALIRMKQSQRAKDYPVIGELSRRLPPNEEIELTTDSDRILALAPEHGTESRRKAVQAAVDGLGRDAVVTRLAQEIDQRQREDRNRLEGYQVAAQPYMRAFRERGISRLPLGEAHEAALRLAEELLPVRPGESDADAE